MDEELKGNEKIEEYIELLKSEPSNETLAALLTSIRRRMQEKGQFVVAVEAVLDGSLQVKAREIKGKGKWFLAFTTFDQQLLGVGQDNVMSTFKADIKQLLEMALSSEGIEGIALNPWDKSFLLNRQMIEIIVGNM